MEAQQGKRCRMRDYLRAFEQHKHLTDEQLAAATGSTLAGARMGRYRLADLRIIAPKITDDGKEARIGENPIWVHIGGELPPKYKLGRKKRRRQTGRTCAEIINTIKADLAILEAKVKQDAVLADAVRSVAKTANGPLFSQGGN